MTDRDKDRDKDKDKDRSKVEAEDHDRASILERLVKRGIESGIGAISRSEDTVRGLVDGMKLPKEVATALLDQVDETKRGLYTVVANEIRDFLRSTNFASDVKKILTGLAFEVKMEVRFKSTDEDGDKVRPDVSAKASVKPQRRTRIPPPPTPREETDAGDDPDDDPLEK